MVSEDCVPPGTAPIGLQPVLVANRPVQHRHTTPAMHATSPAQSHSLPPRPCARSQMPRAPPLAALLLALLALQACNAQDGPPGGLLCNVSCAPHCCMHLRQPCQRAACARSVQLSVGLGLGHVCCSCPAVLPPMHPQAVPTCSWIAAPTLLQGYDDCCDKRNLCNPYQAPGEPPRRDLMAGVGQLAAAAAGAYSAVTGPAKPITDPATAAATIFGERAASTVGRGPLRCRCRTWELPAA